MLKTVQWAFGYPFSAGTLRVVGIGTVGNESYAFNSYTDSMESDYWPSQ